MSSKRRNIFVGAKPRYVEPSDKQGLIDLNRKKIAEIERKKNESNDLAYIARCDNIIAQLKQSIKDREAEEKLIRNYRPSALCSTPRQRGS